MALAKGDAACGTGLSRRVYENLAAGIDMSGLDPALCAAYRARLRLLAHAVASAVVDEIQANGEALVSHNHTVKVR